MLRWLVKLAGGLMLLAAGGCLAMLLLGLSGPRALGPAVQGAVLALVWELGTGGYRMIALAGRGAAAAGALRRGRRRR